MKNTKNTMMKTALVIFASVIMFSVEISAQKTDCSTRTDAEIVKAIYANLEAKYSSQIIHINVVSKDGVVTLQGWATNKKARKEIDKIAKKTSCVKRTINQLTLEVPSGCASGYKKCGDACIPSGEVCNICTARTCN